MPSTSYHVDAHCSRFGLKLCSRVTTLLLQHCSRWKLEAGRSSMVLWSSGWRLQSWSSLTDHSGTWNLKLTHESRWHSLLQIVIISLLYIFSWAVRSTENSLQVSQRLSPPMYLVHMIYDLSSLIISVVNSFVFWYFMHFCLLFFSLHLLINYHNLHCILSKTSGIFSGHWLIYKFSIEVSLSVWGFSPHCCKYHGRVAQIILLGYPFAILGILWEYPHWLLIFLQKSRSNPIHSTHLFVLFWFVRAGTEPLQVHTIGGLWVLYWYMIGWYYVLRSGFWPSHRGTQIGAIAVGGSLDFLQIL